MWRHVEILSQSLGADHPTTQILQRNLTALLQKIARITEPDSPE